MNAKFDRILVAVDNSEMSQWVMAEAIAIAKTHNARLMILHVLSSTEAGYPELPLYPGIQTYHSMLDLESSQKYHERLRGFVERSLEHVRMLAEEAIAQKIPTEYSQNSGDPGRTICMLAETWEADLIVLGRRGRSGLSELFLGSVSNYVLHRAPCSVLTVKGRLPAHQGERVSEMASVAATGSLET